VILPITFLTLLLMATHMGYHYNAWPEKTKIIALPDGKENLMIF